MSEQPTPLAYSYIRFSTPEQAEGDSLRRQASAALAWCEKNNVRLDTSTTFRDLGKSAFTGEHRKNPDRNALAAFLRLVEQGRVPKGSFLIIENLDRLSRQDERAALSLWTQILDAGINIVQLTPETIFRHEKSDMFEIMRALMELSRGHGESARKSERNGASWAQKVKQARQGSDQPPRRKDGRVTKAITSQLPAWVEEKGGELVLIPERAEVVKRIFKLATAEGGHGIASTVKLLTEEGVPAWGLTGWKSGEVVWVRAYVAKILKDRRALGEHQPRGKDRKPDGEPIKDYFPAVVTEAEWVASRVGAAERKRKPGRVASIPNIFAGLLRHARDGDTFFVGKSRGAGQRVLINTAGSEARGGHWSFPADTFERAVLALLAEIDPREIMDGDDGPDETTSLAAELAGVENRIAEMEAELLEGDVAALARVLRSLEARRKELAGQLAEARQKAAHPLSEAWGEARGLLRALDSAPDQVEARLRLRSILRRMVEAVWLVIVPRGRDRFCAAQFWFAEGKRSRSYLILHRPPKGNASARSEGGWRAHSLASAVEPGELDLRQPSHAEALAARLETMDVEAFWSR